MLGYVPGTTPAKWARRWSQRLPDVPLHLVHIDVARQCAGIVDRSLDAALVRVPARRDASWELLSLVPLYEESTVVVIPKGHYLTAGDSLSIDDLAEEPVWLSSDDTCDWTNIASPRSIESHRPETAREALELVASGAGVTIVPMSLARLHNDSGVVTRPLQHGPISRVGLAWLAERTTDSDALLEEMVGIVKGRRPNSSRGLGARSAEATQPARQRTRTPSSRRPRHPRRR